MRNGEIKKAVGKKSYGFFHDSGWISPPSLHLAGRLITLLSAGTLATGLITLFVTCLGVDFLEVIEHPQFPISLVFLSY